LGLGFDDGPKTLLARAQRFLGLLAYGDALLQLLLGQLASGDIAGDDADGLGTVVHDRRGHGFHVDRGAVDPEEFQLGQRCACAGRAAYRTLVRRPGVLAPTIMKAHAAGPLSHPRVLPEGRREARDRLFTGSHPAPTPRPRDPAMSSIDLKTALPGPRSRAL